MPPRRRWLFATVLVAVLLLLHGIPWLVLVWQPGWPVAIAAAGTVVFAGAVVGFPLAMVVGHGRRHRDAPAVLGDTWLGIVWQLFVWSLLGIVASAVAHLAGVAGRTAERWTAVAVLVVVAALCCWGYAEAMRTPRVIRVDVTLDRLGPRLDGLRIVLIADTHYGPIDRTPWSRRLVDLVNSLEADVVAHAGDLADGTVAQRAGQVSPLTQVQARDARVYITGNHEYFSGAQPWVEHMDALGWTVLHNRHIVVARGDDRLAIAGVDDATASGSGVLGHGTDLSAALAGLGVGVPIVLLAHQPKMARLAVSAGVDLQLSGHTHGGQIWPFHLLVRLDQGALHGLSTPGGRTQLYTTRGSGFWGPPFRVFAPSEVTVLTLRAAPDADHSVNQSGSAHPSQSVVAARRTPVRRPNSRRNRGLTPPRRADSATRIES
jgi:predicted MPP superfamily phosphohydrolase